MLTLLFLKKGSDCDHNVTPLRPFHKEVLSGIVCNFLDRCSSQTAGFGRAATWQIIGHSGQWMLEYA